MPNPPSPSPSSSPSPPSPDQLADIEAIKALKHRYWRVCDGRDGAGFRDCFVRSGARLDYGPLGVFDDVEPIAAIFDATTSARHGDGWAMVEQHHGSMPEIAITGHDEATGTWAVQHRRLDLVERTDTTSVGVYHDRYRRVDGRWLISASKCTMNWVLVRPIGQDEQIHQLSATPARAMSRRRTIENGGDPDGSLG